MRLIAEAHGNSIGVHAQRPVAARVRRGRRRRASSTFQDFPLQWFYDCGTETNPGFVEEAQRQIADMAYLLHSHPSVVYYACHNEPLRMFVPTAPEDDTPERDVGERHLDAALLRDAAVDRRLAPRARGVGHRRRRPLLLGLAHRPEPLPGLRAPGVVRERVRLLDRRAAGREVRRPGLASHYRADARVGEPALVHRLDRRLRRDAGPLRLARASGPTRPRPTAPRSRSTRPSGSASIGASRSWATAGTSGPTGGATRAAVSSTSIARPSARTPRGATRRARCSSTARTDRSCTSRAK